MMDQTSYDIFLNALREADPELASVVTFAKGQNSDDDRVKTFEDCARVEQDIIFRLSQEAKRLTKVEQRD